MTRRQSPTFSFLLLLVTIGSLVAVTFADDIVDGELPLDGDSAPPSLPSETFGDIIGSSGDTDNGPTGAPAGSPVEDGGMGPAGSDENVSGSPVDGGDADGGSDGGSPPTNTPAAKEEKSPSGASAVGIGASTAMAFVGFFAF